jgi:transposase
MVAQPLDAGSLVFVDEMGTNTSLSPLYGWSKKGARAYCSIPRNRGKNTTLLASMTIEGLGQSLAVEGATNREVFETYVEQILAPTLRRGQVVVMDNLTAHKGERVKEIIEQRGCELMYLPPYSPDLNPIEEAFGKIKGLMRKAQARRSREALLEAMGTRRSRLSVPKIPVASSSTAATVRWFKRFDRRCRPRSSWHGCVQADLSRCLSR